MFSTALLILWVSVSYVHSYELTQPGSMMVRPGQSLTINCKVSYSVTSEHTGWIRQPAGKALEWIGNIYSWGSTDYSDKLKNKFSISRDTGTNTITLQGQNLQTEDTAVYYCARYTWWGGFDYWGKGTQVTVEGKEMPLSIFPVTECPSGNQFQIGCMSTGLQRDLPFEWFDSNNVKLTSGVVQFPATLRDEAYAKMSFITVKKEDFNNDNYFKCKVGNGSATIPETKTPTVNLVKVSEGESVMCVAENFFPKDFTIKLKEDGLEASSQDWPATRKSPALHYSAGSLLKVNKTLWDKNVKYSCEIKHGTEVITKTRSFTGTFTVTIHRPVAKDLFIYKKAKIQCDITGGNKMEVEGAQLSWKFQGKPVNDTHITSDEVKQTEELYIKTSTLTLDDSDWFSGAEVECFTKRDQDTISKKASIKHGDESCSVQIYTPNDNVPSVEKIPLVCQVNSSSLGDVYIMWKKSDGSFVEGTITAADSGGKFVFSFLTVTSEEYNNVITCAVKHANMKNLNSPKMATASKSKDNCPKCPVCEDC